MWPDTEKHLKPAGGGALHAMLKFSITYSSSGSQLEARGRNIPIPSQGTHTHLGVLNPSLWKRAWLLGTRQLLPVQGFEPSSNDRFYLQRKHLSIVLLKAIVFTFSHCRYCANHNTGARMHTFTFWTVAVIRSNLLGETQPLFYQIQAWNESLLILAAQLGSWLTPSGGSAEKVRCSNYAGGVAEEMGVRRRWFRLDHWLWTRCYQVHRKGGERDGVCGGEAARTALMTRVVFLKREVAFFKGKSIRKQLVLVCLGDHGDMVKLSPPANQCWPEALLIYTHTRT